jgi:hypothetical protein
MIPQRVGYRTTGSLAVTSSDRSCSRCVSPRSLSRVARLGELEPGHQFRVTIFGESRELHAGRMRRTYWEGLAPQRMANSVVFFDPDIGFETKTCYEEKWILHGELSRILEHSTGRFDRRGLPASTPSDSGRSLCRPREPHRLCEFNHCHPRKQPRVCARGSYVSMRRRRMRGLSSACPARGRSHPRRTRGCVERKQTDIFIGFQRFVFFA